MIWLRSVIAAVLLLPQAVTGQEATARFGNGATEFLLRSTTDIAIIRPVIDRFVALNPDLTIAYEQWGSNDLFAVSRAECTGDGVAADAVFSSAVQQLVWLVNAACAHPYRSSATLALPRTRRWRDELWGITTEPAVIVYNKDLLADDQVPRSRFALLDALRSNPEFYRDRIATYDIASSGLGYLFAYADSLEASTFGALLEGFARVDAVATCCSSEIIEAVADGRFLIAYNVLGSYAANITRPEVGMVLPQDYTLFLSRGLMIPRGARHKAAATALLDFLLSAEAQDLLRQAGLVMGTDTAEADLTASARRFIPLSPSLLVSLDANRSGFLLRYWDDTFAGSTGP